MNAFPWGSILDEGLGRAKVITILKKGSPLTPLFDVPPLQFRSPFILTKLLVPDHFGILLLAQALLKVSRVHIITIKILIGFGGGGGGGV